MLQPSSHSPLTPREYQILLLLWNNPDATIVEISRMMYLSDRTVSNYMYNMANKMRVAPRRGAVIKRGLEMRLIEVRYDH